MKGSTLFLLLFIITTIIGNSQTNENSVEQISSKISLHLSATDAASLFTDSRFIQVGFEGNTNDINDMVGYFDRFLINGKTMVEHHELVNTLSGVTFYKFYLDPLSDANDFQRMLELSGFKNFKYKSNILAVQHFSNTVYSFIKSNTKE